MERRSQRLVHRPFRFSLSLFPFPARPKACSQAKILRIAHPRLPPIIFRQCQENPSDDPGKHSHEPARHIGDSVIGINDFLNIFGVHIDDKLSLTTTH